MTDSSLSDWFILGPKNEPSKRYEVPTTMMGGMPFVSEENSKRVAEIIKKSLSSRLAFSSEPMLASTPAGIGIDWSELRKRHTDFDAAMSAYLTEMVHAKAYRELMGEWKADPFDVADVEVPAQPKPKAKPLTDIPLTKIESDWI